MLQQDHRLLVGEPREGNERGCLGHSPLVLKEAWATARSQVYDEKVSMHTDVIASLACRLCRAKQGLADVSERRDLILTWTNLNAGQS